MKNTSRTPFKRRSLPAHRMQMSAASEQWLVSEPMAAGQAIPRLITPAIADIDLIEWASENHNYIDQQLREHRSLLFRGFGISSADKFSQFVSASSAGELLEYRDRSTPRESRGTKIYTSTVFPADQRINLHNEGTYWRKWAMKIYFCCTTAPREGGETPIADVRKVYQRIPPAIRDRFSEKQILYVRNYNDGFGLTWQEVFQTQQKSDVEEYCRTNEIEFEWKSEDRLRTKQIRPAVRIHPETGEPVWFNHGAFFHIAALEPSVRATLLSELGEEGLPYQTYFGDGSPIDHESVEAILDAYRAEQVLFTWRAGDVLLQDNMAIAHGREPYIGDREVLTAMTEPYSEQAYH